MTLSSYFALVGAVLIGCVAVLWVLGWLQDLWGKR